MELAKEGRIAPGANAGNGTASKGLSAYHNTIKLWMHKFLRLTLKAKIPGADKAKFDELTAMAKAGCPVSKVLNTKITLDATLL